MKRPPPSREPRRPFTAWDPVARWYDALVGEEGSEYHRKLVMPGALRLLDLRPGERVLDLACGQGVFCRLLQKAPVHVTGVDASEELVHLARRRSSKHITYLVGDARRLEELPSESFDAMACLLAIQNIDPVEPVFDTCARLLRPGGRLVLVLTHPCFRVARQSGWGWDEERELQYRRVDRYATPLKVPIQIHPGSQPRRVTWTFHRPLQTYVQGLVRAGMWVDVLEEWASHKASQPGPRANAENLARQEIPLFLALRAVKVSPHLREPPPDR
ncbi:MAG: class I SAM-dependent methyltransferase [Chloroflexi bacterium]|nr:class I SAM-dependent methyltransferase [Chloroflexota bacterium]